MRNTLVQKDRFFNKRVYELAETGLSVRQTGFLNSREYFVDYDNIGIRPLKEKFGRNGWFGASIIGFVLAAILTITRWTGGEVGSGAEIFYLLLGVFCIVIFMITYKRKFYLIDPGHNNGIEFIYNSPSKKELDEFIETLTTRRNQFLDQKYGEINTMLPYDHNHQNLLWLFNNDVINKAEYEKRYTELTLKFGSYKDRRLDFDLGEN